MKLNISAIVGAITLVGLFSGFILAYGNLPKAVAKLEDKTETYDEKILEMRAEQRYIREKIDDTFELLKKKKGLQ